MNPAHTIYRCRYWQHIFANSSNRNRTWTATLLSILLFAVFKLIYPFPDFFSDSYSYLEAARNHWDINIWPIGYSKFLSLVHWFSHSATVLVAIQYFSLQLALLHFYFTLQCLFSPDRLVQNTLFILFFLNPLTLYLSNTVNSDALFAILSILWFTNIIRIVARPMPHQFCTQAILLLLCFTVRNNAYYYPIITILAFLLSPHSTLRKFIGSTLPFALLIPFILFTREASFKLSGTRQFSLFTGWQLANNALYIYNKVSIDSANLDSPQARELNRLAMRFFQPLNPDHFQKYLGSYVGNFFIRQPEAPLKSYFRLRYKPKTETEIVKCWAQASVGFGEFGQAVILHHPVAYLRYFVYSNARNYLIPPLSHLARYNYGQTSIDPVAQAWFGFRAPRVRALSYTIQGELLVVYQALFLVANLLFIWQIIGFFARNKHNRLHQPEYRICLIGGAFFLLNLGFSLLSTVNILRYQFVPLIILSGFGLMLVSSDESSHQLNQQYGK
jgi:hypothetical protein